MVLIDVDVHSTLACIHSDQCFLYWMKLGAEMEQKKVLFVPQVAFGSAERHIR